MYSVIRFCDGCHRDGEFNSTDGREWQCQTCAYRRYGPLTAAQDREKGRPGPNHPRPAHCAPVPAYTGPVKCARPGRGSTGASHPTTDLDPW